MRFSILALVAAATAVTAVDISGAPPCAQTCLKNNEGTSTCDPNATDYTCFCNDKNYYNVVAQCVESTCSSSDAAATLSWYKSVCPGS